MKNIIKPVRLIKDLGMNRNDIVSELKVMEDDNGFFVGRTLSNNVSNKVNVHLYRYTEYLETKEDAEELLPVIKAQAEEDKERYKEITREILGEEEEETNKENKPTQTISEDIDE